MTNSLSRRQLLITGGAAATVLAGNVLRSPLAAAETAPPIAQKPMKDPFRYCLNTSTISGQKLSLVDEIELIAKAGYTGIEPWIREIDAYTQTGGQLEDLAKRIADAGLTVESAIGFANWIVDDDEARKKGLESAKRDMELVQRIGGTRIAAPPVGVQQQKNLSLADAARRYFDLCEVGQQMGVTPMVELWGFSTQLSRIGEAAYVAIESGHPSASLLLDVYHIYKGGSDFHGLKLLNGSRMYVFHFNDYPADPPRERINDADRVFCGDGVAPLSQIVSDLYQSGFRGALSLELFNRKYWEQAPAEVARTGLEKLREMTAKALNL